MRLARDPAGCLQLLATARDLELVDAAFHLLLNAGAIDDWQVRTGASRDELWATWWALAGKRPDPAPGEEAFSIEVSERALEVLEPVLFALARGRLLGTAEVLRQTAAELSEWRRLWLRTRELMASAELLPTAESAAGPMTLGDGSPGDTWFGAFRQVGGTLRRTSADGISLDTGDIVASFIEDVTLRNLACHAIRLIGTEVHDATLDGAIRACSVIDCTLEDVRVSGTLQDVTFVGNAYRGFDLRPAMLAGCRFFDVGLDREAFLPSGPDCFVVPVRVVAHALDTIRARIGEPAFRACTDWLRAEEAEFLSVGEGFWASVVVPFGAPPNDEIEAAVVERLYRSRVVTLE